MLDICIVRVSLELVVNHFIIYYIVQINYSTKDYVMMYREMKVNRELWKKEKKDEKICLLFFAKRREKDEKDMFKLIRIKINLYIYHVSER